MAHTQDRKWYIYEIHRSHPNWTYQEMRIDRYQPHRRRQPVSV